jgi:hypothetical protein
MAGFSILNEVVAGFIMVFVILLVVLFLFTHISGAITEAEDIATFNSLKAAMIKVSNGEGVQTISPFEIKTEDHDRSYYGIYYITPSVARAILKGYQEQFYNLDDHTRKELGRCSEGYNDACVCFFKFRAMPIGTDTYVYGKEYPTYVFNYCPPTSGCSEAYCPMLKVKHKYNSEYIKLFSMIYTSSESEFNEYEQMAKDRFVGKDEFWCNFAHHNGGSIYEHFLDYIKVYGCVKVAEDLNCLRDTKDAQGHVIKKPCFLLDKDNHIIIWLGTGTGMTVVEGGDANLKAETARIYKTTQGIVIDTDYGNGVGEFTHSCDNINDVNCPEFPFRVGCSAPAWLGGECDYT